MIFIDTTILVGAADRRDALHDDGRTVLKRVASGELGTALVSDFILDETLTILGRRRGVGPTVAAAFAQGLLGSPRVRCLYLDAPLFQEALVAYRRYGPTLSFTDATTVSLMARTGCRDLYSHDGGFDRVPAITRRTATE